MSNTILVYCSLCAVAIWSGQK